MAGVRPAGREGLSCAGLPQAALIEGEMVRTAKTLKPCQKGTQGLPARFGRLLDIRWRYGEDHREPVKIVALAVQRRSREGEARCRATEAQGAPVWILRREAAERLDLTSRAIGGAVR